MAADLIADGTWRATEVSTDLGPLVVAASDRGVAAADLGRPFDDVAGRLEAAFDVAVVRGDRALGAVRREAAAYLGGRARALRSPVDLRTAGDGFRRRVYEATMRVPFGELRTYGDVAADAGSPRAWRAAGSALRVCPIELWVPCHRIVPAGPGLGAYGGHPEHRAFLLRLEGSWPMRRDAGRSGPRAGRWRS